MARDTRHPIVIDIAVASEREGELDAHALGLRGDVFSRLHGSCMMTLKTPSSLSQGLRGSAWRGGGHELVGGGVWLVGIHL